jgi:cell wall-associated NlpC family hydrolase
MKVAFINSVINAAQNYIGTPYKWGGNDKNGIDCAGLVCQAFLSVGILLPRVASDQANIGEKVNIDELQAGDLVFFTNQQGSSTITHVGLVTNVDYSKDKVTMIHASSGPKGVMEDNVLAPWWEPLFVIATRPNAFL